MAEGHNEPCYACGEFCNSLAGDPGQWPTMLPAEQSARPFHMKCAAAMMRDAARYRNMREAEWILRRVNMTSAEVDYLNDAEIARKKQP